MRNSHPTMIITHRGAPDREVRFRSDRNVAHPVLDLVHTIPDACN